MAESLPEELTEAPALEITEKLTAAKALQELETTAAEALTDAQAVALAELCAFAVERSFDN